jgi:hypothetical protein
LPYTVGLHSSAPTVRVQPAVSVSVEVVEPQFPPWQTGSVRVRVREPVSEHMLAYAHAVYAPKVGVMVPQLAFSVTRVQPAVSVSVFCTAAQVPFWHSGSVRVRVREPLVAQVLPYAQVV